jgi:MFS family permease
MLWATARSPHTQTSQALILAALAAGVLTHVLEPVLLVGSAFLLGCCEVLFFSAAQALIPDLVPAPRLAAANGRQQAATVTGQLFAGPPVGSALFAISPVLPFGLNALSFSVSALLLRRLPRQTDLQLRP